MNFFKKNQHRLLVSISLLMINACSSQQIVAVSAPHAYNNDYGMVQDTQAEAMLRAERIAMQNQVIENDNEQIYLAPGTFLAEDYVQQPEVITYKYKFDPKFYSKAEWRKMP